MNYTKREEKIINKIANIINGAIKRNKRATFVDGVKSKNTHNIYNERFIVTEKHHKELHTLFTKLSLESNRLYNALTEVQRKYFLNNDMVHSYQQLKEYLLKGNHNDKVTNIFNETNHYINLGVVYDVANIWYKFYQVRHSTRIPQLRKGKNRKFSFTINHNNIKLIENNNNNSTYQYLLQLPFGKEYCIPTNIHIHSIIDVRVTPNRGNFIVDIKYRLEKNSALQNRKDTYKIDRNRIAGIDFGVSNLMAIANNIGVRPLLINGKRLAASNTYYNNLINKYLENSNGRYTKRICALEKRRININKEFMNRACNILIDYLERNMIKTLVLGISSTVYDGFITNEESFRIIDYSYLINRIELLCQQYNINVIKVDEDYTSSTSILDGQQPIKENSMHSRRFTSRLYMTQNFGVVNCDINSAMQIICKYNSEAFNNIIIDLGIVNYAQPIKTKNFSICNEENIKTGKVYYGDNSKHNITQREFIEYLINNYNQKGLNYVASKALISTFIKRKLMGTLITPVSIKL